MTMRQKLLLAIADVHSGNAEEAERIVAVTLRALEHPTQAMQDAGASDNGWSAAMSAWGAMIRAAQEGK